MSGWSKHDLDMWVAFPYGLEIYLQKTDISGWSCFCWNREYRANDLCEFIVLFEGMQFPNLDIAQEYFAGSFSELGDTGEAI